GQAATAGLLPAPRAPRGLGNPIQLLAHLRIKLVLPHEGGERRRRDIRPGLAGVVGADEHDPLAELDVDVVEQLEPPDRDSGQHPHTPRPAPAGPSVARRAAIPGPFPPLPGPAASRPAQSPLPPFASLTQANPPG